MNPVGRILILGSTREASEKLAGSLANGELQSVVASGVGDAIKQLGQKPFDCLIVSSGLQRQAPVEFLGKAREFVPRVLRALYVDEPIEEDLREFINRALPCVFLKDPIDTEAIVKLIQDHRKAHPQSESVPGAVYTRKDVVAFKARITHLERDNSKLKWELNRLNRRGDPMGGGVAALMGGALPGGGTVGGHPLTQSAPPAPAAGLVAAPTPAAPAPAAAPGTNPFQKAESLLGGGVGQTQAAPPPQPASPQGIDHLSQSAPAPAESKQLAPRVLEIIAGLDSLVDKPDIRLPVLPAIGMEVQKLAASESTTYEQIAEKVELDPSMSARILEVANSPLYSGTQKTQTIQNAISRIGIRETRNILQAVVAEGLFNTKDKILKDLLNQLWLHSLAVAYSNEILAKALFISESSDFFMMGLLHDIGKLLIVHLLMEGVKDKMWTREELTEEVIQDILVAHHNVIGMRLMEKWEYPEAFHSVVELHNDDEKVYLYDEAVVVTYYSNLLSRKIGLSLMPNIDALLDNKQIAQSLNMSDDARTKISETMTDMVEKIRKSYLKA